MDRLTKLDLDYQTYITNSDNIKAYPEEVDTALKNADIFGLAITRLAEYENLGTVEELTELKNWAIKETQKVINLLINFEKEQNKVAVNKLEDLKKECLTDDNFDGIKCYQNNAVDLINSIIQELKGGSDEEKYNI